MRNRTADQVAADRVEIYLIRHGYTASNEQKRYLGRTDEELSGEGIRMLMSHPLRGTLHPQCCFVSPMRRCRRTAELLFPEVTAQKVIGSWTETDFGAFEGKNYEELNGDPDYQRWIDSGGTLPFPGGESREAFVRRSVEGYRQMLRMLRENPPGGPVAAVVHGGTIMAVASTFGGGVYYDYQLACGEGLHCMADMETEKIMNIRRII